MCQCVSRRAVRTRHPAPTCKHARHGIQAFATYLDPPSTRSASRSYAADLDAVLGLELPGHVRIRALGRHARTRTRRRSRTSTASTTAYDAYWPYWMGRQQPAYRRRTPSYYVVASLEGADGNLADDYVVDDPVQGWILNPLSAFIQRLDCTGARGGTSYALSIESAQHELTRNGRGNVQDVIIFLSDGGANMSPTKVPAGHWTNNPSSRAHRRVEQRSRLPPTPKRSGTVIYTIGYDLAKAQNGGAPENCKQPNASGHSTNNPETGVRDVGKSSELRCRRRAQGNGKSVQPPRSHEHSQLLLRTHTANAGRHLQSDRPRPRGVTRSARRQHVDQPDLPLDGQRRLRICTRDADSRRHATTFETRRRTGSCRACSRAPAHASAPPRGRPVRNRLPGLHRADGRDARRGAAGGRLPVSSRPAAAREPAVLAKVNSAAVEPRPCEDDVFAPAP